MSTPIGSFEDHPVGAWFIGLFATIWLGTNTLVALGTRFLLYGGVIMFIIVKRTVFGQGRGELPGAVLHGIAVHGPLLVAGALLVNHIPVSRLNTTDHEVSGIGRYCMGSRQPYCRPVVNFVDGAFADWRRARIYQIGVPKNLFAVRYTTYQGLLGYTVIHDREELDAHGDVIE